jgi:hypothetical protein
VTNFFNTLAEQRYDDHRYYHHSRINQSLHLLSAITFCVSYLLLFIEPALAAILAWCVAMTSRQSGHFFFEPRGYDEVNQATDEYKEQIKVGYNIHRKIVLLAVWIAMPVLIYVEPSVFGFVKPYTSPSGYVHDVGISWLAVGAGGLLFRVLQITFMRDGLLAGLAWATKIVTDPFHDIALYWRAPFALARGELIDPMLHIRAKERARASGTRVANPLASAPLASGSGARAAQAHPDHFPQEAATHAATR